MGILNITPDSFSDGGLYTDQAVALQHVERMLAEGADIIDVGSESTRPGAQRVGAAEQIARSIDIIAACRQQLPERVDISIDTTRARVAERALNVGATMINDISAGVDDPEILSLAAERKVPICLMHMRGEPGTMQDKPVYGDVVAEVKAYLLQRVEAATCAGVAPDRIILDPGIGFGKTSRHNMQLLRQLTVLTGLGFSVLLGTSRKRFMQELVSGTLPPRERVTMTCATTALGVQAGVRLFRVHDVGPNRQAADLSWAIKTV